MKDQIEKRGKNLIKSEGQTRPEYCKEKRPKSGLINEEVSHLHKGERETRVERRRRRQFLGVFSPSCRDQAWFKKEK